MAPTKNKGGSTPASVAAALESPKSGAGENTQSIATFAQAPHPLALPQSVFATLTRGQAAQQRWNNASLDLNVDRFDDLQKPLMPLLTQSLRGRVLELALDARGCRLLQRALELGDDQQQVLLAHELKGHVCEALESPHANHVLQQVIELMRPSAVNFIVPELRRWGKPSALARHRYGCRVLERLIEHFPPSDLALLVDEVLEEALHLCRHVYGNFVMQHVLEHGEQRQKRCIIDVLCSDLSGAALDQHACSVLDKALSYGSPGDQLLLAEQVVNETGLLAAMATMRGGFAATQRLFRVVGGRLLEDARSQLVSQAQEIQRTKHGRALIAAVLPDYRVQHMSSVPSPVRTAAPTALRGSNATGPRSGKSSKTSLDTGAEGPAGLGGAWAGNGGARAATAASGSRGGTHRGRRGDAARASAADV
mmetsp:Transcript_56508/g.109048  ORF Transcript_56508/g.109048 Transcript_56508/m.109048 type:complete len:423 (-) Transcript_56508:196-1464(-)